MEPEKYLENYSGQTTDELIGLESEYRIDSLLSAFEKAVDEKEARLGSGKISKEERIIQAIEGLGREVNNGGYSQFFFNSSFRFVGVIVEALQQIGCQKFARLTQRAIKAVGLPDDSTQEQFQEKIADNEALESKLESIDDKFYEIEEDIEGGLFAFIKANRKSIAIGATGG